MLCTGKIFFSFFSKPDRYIEGSCKMGGEDLFCIQGQQEKTMVTDGSRIQLTIKPMMPAFNSYHDKIQVMAIFAARG